MRFLKTFHFYHISFAILLKKSRIFVKIFKLMKKLLLFLFALVTMATHAQSPGDVAQTYGANTGFNGTVFTLVVQPDGKILVGVGAGGR